LNSFEKINKAYNSVFRPDNLSIGIVIPIESYSEGMLPMMKDQLAKVKLVEQFGYKALWVRDVPLHVPTFGDAGQMFDPFTYLGYLAGQTTKIALGVASIALPLHHPVHVVKSATTIDQLSGGRVLIGIASGDRPTEYPSMAELFENRGVRFREAYSYIRAAQDAFPFLADNSYGKLDGQSDILPKATGHKLPLLITGHSQQTTDWVADNGDGWMYYPRNLYMQEHNIQEWRSRVLAKQKYDKPFMQSLYVDLHKDDDFKPQGIHLGFRLGVNYLKDLFLQLRKIGVNHVALNLRFNEGNMEATLEKIAANLFPLFHLDQENTAEK